MFKVKIRSPKALGLEGAGDFEELWHILEVAIERIYDGDARGLSFEVLYGTVYKMVLRRNSNELYEKLREAINFRLCELKKKELDCEKSLILTKLNDVWQTQCNCLRMISDVTMYLDKVYCKENRKPLVYDMGLALFRDNIVKPLSPLIHSMIMHHINLQRQDSATVLDFYLIQELISMMETLVDVDDSYYLTEFEPFLLKETERFFTNFVNSNGLSAKEYVNEVQRLLEHEKFLHSRFLNNDTSVKVLNVTKKVLITDNLHFIITKGLPELIEFQELSSLKLLFGLCQQPEDRSELLKQLVQCIVNEGLAVEEDQSLKKKAQIAIKWINDIISIREKYEKLLEQIGDDHVGNNKSVSEAFSIISNQNGKKSAEYLALFIDFTLRSCKQLESSTKKSLEHCVSLFRLLRDKDIFEKLYKQQLSKRLLQQRSSLELEKQMIGQMKEEVGISFTAKLEGMLRDIIISQGYNTKFAQLQEVPCDYDVNVLTTTCWPFQNVNTSQDIVLPSNLERLRLDFENFYIKSHSGRTLKWAYHLGSMDIGFQFSKSYHVLSMPVYAAVIFMLFEDYNELTMQEIGDLTHIPEQELHRQLLSIAVASKTRILKKHPASKTIAITDKFYINDSFTAPTLKVKVLTVVAKYEPNSQGYAELVQPMKEVSEERKQNLEAVIVSILKLAKTMTHLSLLESVQERLSDKFDVSTEFFKDRVQHLMEKEYVQRDSDDPLLYHYLP